MCFFWLPLTQQADAVPGTWLEDAANIWDIGNGLMGSSGTEEMKSHLWNENIAVEK